MIENDSSYSSGAVTFGSPTDDLPSTASSIRSRLKLSFGRLSVLFVMVATGWSFGYAMTPRQVLLLEPQDEDLVVLNGCVISACSYMATVRAQHRLEKSFWSRVMLVRYNNNDAGHAYCVWQTDGHTFGYDRAGGTFPIPGNSRDPKSIAQSLAVGLEEVMKKPMLVARAEFVEPKNAKLYTY